MKIVLAPDSYKGSMTAKEACDAMEVGIKRVLPQAEIIKVPMADGGEGTVQSLVDATGGEIYTANVTNPIGQKVKASYGILGDGDTAVIEMAEASGLYLIPENRRNPLRTTTYGTGELIKAALDRGCRKFILGLGGSATNDGGAGMAQALGVKFRDKDGEQLDFGGAALSQLADIDVSSLDPRIQESRFVVACDVTNPLCGPNGASYIFGPQKGASPAMVEQLDQNLKHYATIIKQKLDVEVLDIPGSGAAGGLGAGMIAFLEAELQRGIEIVIEASKLKEHMKGASLVFSGEGQCDHQTKNGKTPFGVAQIAQAHQVPVILIAGSIGDGIEELYEYGVHSVFAMVDKPMSLDKAMADSKRLLADATERIMRTVIL